MCIRWYLILREVKMAFEFVYFVLIKTHFASHHIVAMTDAINDDRLHPKNHHNAV